MTTVQILTILSLWRVAGGKEAVDLFYSRAYLQLHGGRRGRLALWKRLTPRAGLGLSMEVGVGMGGPGQGAETSFFSESVPGGPVGETCSFCSLFYR